MNILFVCVGNACRSPMAEALFNYESKKLGRSDIARSAGIRPFLPVLSEPRIVLKEIGVNMDGHNSKPLSTEMVDWADKIILLDRGIKEYSVSPSLNNEDKIIVWDIEDPFNMPLSRYRRIRDELQQRILEFFNCSLRS